MSDTPSGIPVPTPEPEDLRPADPPDVPLHDSLAARRAAEAVRDAEGYSVGTVREELWQSCVAAPVTGFVPQWADAWEQFGAELLAGHVRAAADTFVQIDGMLTDLQGLWEGAAAVLTAWYRECAEPYNRRHHGAPAFGRVWFPPEPAWLSGWRRPHVNPSHWRGWWGDVPAGPVGTPARCALWVQLQIPEHMWSDARFRGPVDAIALFGRLGTGRTTSADVERNLARLDTPDQLAGVGLVLAAIVLPAPDLLDRFFSGPPSLDEVTLAEGILGATPDDIHGLREEFRSRRAASYTPPPPAPVPEGVPPEWFRPTTAPDDWAGQLREFAGVNEALADMGSIQAEKYGRGVRSLAGTVAERWREARHLGERVGTYAPDEPDIATPAAYRNALYALAQWAREAADRASSRDGQAARTEPPPATGRSGQGTTAPLANTPPAPGTDRRGTADQPKDGPEGGCWVWWQGVRHDVPKGNVYKLIRYFWDRDVAGYDDLDGPVFDGPVEPQTIRSKLSATNNALRKIGIPWRLAANSTARVVTKKPRG